MSIFIIFVVFNWTNEYGYKVNSRIIRTFAEGETVGVGDCDNHHTMGPVKNDETERQKLSNFPKTTLVVGRARIQTRSPIPEPALRDDDTTQYFHCLFWGGLDAEHLQ